MNCLTRLIPILCLGLFVSCDDDDPSDTTDDGMCECPTPNAQGVDYANASSQLGADNVQDAVDELAARPLPEAPIAGRVEMRAEEITAPESQPFFVLSLGCPRATDLVLGGSCGPAVGTAQLRGSRLGFTEGGQGIDCSYAANGQTLIGNIGLTVVCLKTE